jgi:dTDP-glucose 4,6-dehydratase
VDAGRPGETYHLGTGSEQTNLEVVRQICECVDAACPGLPHHPTMTLLRHVVDRPGHDRRYALDIESTELALSWKARSDFRDRLRETVAWYLAHRDWCEEVTRGRYDGRRLGAPAFLHAARGQT